MIYNLLDSPDQDLLFINLHFAFICACFGGILQTFKKCQTLGQFFESLYVTPDETVAPAFHTFDQISPGYFLDILTEVQHSPDCLMPNLDEFDLVRGKKGKCYFAEPVAGHFLLLSDNSLSNEFHHCLITHPL